MEEFNLQCIQARQERIAHETHECQRETYPRKLGGLFVIGAQLSIAGGLFMLLTTW